MDDQKPRYFVYKDMELIRTLEDDPVIALERLEETIDRQDGEIARLANALSDREAEVIEARRAALEASDNAEINVKAEALLHFKIAEITQALRDAKRKIVTYAKRFRR